MIFHPHLNCYNYSMSHWFEDSERNRISAKEMVRDGHYDWGLFVWHLSLEKLLKGVIDQTKKEAPFIHNLVKLAQVSELPFSSDQYDQLAEITSFNLEARYDDYKYAFYKKATKEYSQKWSQVCEDLYLWIKQYTK